MFIIKALDIKKGSPCHIGIDYMDDTNNFMAILCCRESATRFNNIVGAKLASNILKYKTEIIKVSK